MIETLGISLFIILNFLEFSVLGFCYLKSDYTPFKAKQLSALFLGTFFCSIWGLGTLHALGFLPYTVPIFSYCALYMVWFQTVFGVNAFGGILSYRLLRLYYILVLTKPAGGPKFWGFLFFQWSPSLGLALYSLVSKDLIPVRAIPNPTYLDCFFLSGTFKYLLYIALAFQFIFIFWTNYQISSITSKSFNEFKENQRCLTLFVIILIANLILNALHFWESRPWAFIILFSALLVPIMFIFTSLASPLRGYWMDREGYLREFERGIRSEQLPKDLKYGVASDSLGSGGRSTVKSKA